MNRISNYATPPVSRPAAALRRCIAADLVFALGLAASSGLALGGEQIVVPNALAEQDGNTASTTPGDDNQAGIRIQYMLDASQFQALSGQAYLTGIASRPDRAPGASGPKSITVQVYASTTPRAVADMTTEFSENIGIDRTLVLDGTLTLSSANLPGPGDTRQFDYVYPFTTPFLYDPAAGNLVLELVISHATGPSMRFDSVTGSQVVRNLSAPNAPSATSGQFFEAAVFQFRFEAVPAITIRTSQIEVCWDSVPEATYQVEYRTDADSAEWMSLTNCVHATATSTCILDSIGQGAPRRFYRVVRNNCTP